MQGSVASLDAKRIAKDLAARIENVPALVGRHVPQARQLFRKLIDSKLACEPFKENGQRGYRYRATGTYARLFPAGIAVNDGGGGQGDRTPDLVVANDALSQLS